MKKTILLVLTILVLLLTSTMPDYAHGAGVYHSGGHYYGGGTYYRGDHWRGGIWIGPGWGWGSWWWGAPYYPYYTLPPVVIEQQPPIYVEPAPEPQEQSYYWYYCRNPQGYYPYVPQCPGGWIKVVPSPVPPDVKE